MRSLFTLLVSLGLCAAPAQARELEVEVDVLHVSGMLPVAELEAMLSDGRLGVEAGYQPLRLIEGVTARRERTMPIGSKLFAIPQSLNLQGAQIERSKRRLRFRVPEIPPGHGEYRLRQLALRAPMTPGIGRPQPDLHIDLLQEPPRKTGAQETALFSRFGAFDLGLRLRYRWSGEQGAAKTGVSSCSPDIHALGNGEYRFRPQHRVSGLFRFLSSVVQSDPPSRPPAGQRSLRLREPFPEPLTGIKLSRNHLVQLQIDGQPVERLSLYGEQSGPGQCRRTRLYEALYFGGKPVAIQRSVQEDSCKGPDVLHSESVEAQWLDDGSLARYITSAPQGSRDWDGFDALADAACGSKPAATPPAGDVQALQSELQQIRAAFLRP